MRMPPLQSFRAARLAVVLLMCTTSSITFARGDALLNAPFIIGSTRYSVAELADCFAARIGQPVSRELLDAIAVDIQARYRRDGLVVPSVVALDSELRSTTPRLHVFESSLDEIALRGDAGPYAAMLVEQADELRANVIDKQRLQAYLRRVNELPGLGVRARFEPRATGSHHLTLVLDARYDAVDGAISINNRGTAEIGRTIIAARTTFNGVLGSHSAVSLSGATSNEPDRYRYVGAGAQRRIGAVEARVDVADTHAKLSNDYEYHAQRARLELRKTVLESDTLRVEPLLGFMLRDARGEYPDARVSDVSTRTAEFGVIARQSGERTSGYARFGFSRGLDAFGASAFMRSGIERDLTFSKSSLDLALVHAFDARWLVRLDAEGQWTDVDLPAGERFAFGGSVFGRAFDPGELVGDRGAAISVQLERKQRWGGEWLRHTSLYLQGDYGWTRDNLFGDDDAASMTAGVKAAFASLIASLELSTPLDRSNENPHANNPRAFAQMQVRF